MVARVRAALRRRTTPNRGARDLPTVRMIKSYGGQANEFGRGVNFGVYAEVAGEGVVRVGDRSACGRRSDHGAGIVAAIRWLR